MIKSKVHSTLKESWGNYRSIKTHEACKKYLSALKNATKLARNATRSLEIQIAKNVQDEPEDFYRYAKDKFKYRDDISELIDKDVHPTKNHMESAALLNEYLAFVLT